MSEMAHDVDASTVDVSDDVGGWPVDAESVWSARPLDARPGQSHARASVRPDVLCLPPRLPRLADSWGQSGRSRIVQESSCGCHEVSGCRRTLLHPIEQLPKRLRMFDSCRGISFESARLRCSLRAEGR